MSIAFASPSSQGKKRNWGHGFDIDDEEEIFGKKRRSVARLDQEQEESFEDEEDSMEMLMREMVMPEPGIGRWNCGGQTCQLGRWKRLPGSVISQGELEQVTNGSPSEVEYNCVLFGVEVDANQVSGLEDMLDGLLQALRLLEMAVIEPSQFRKLDITSEALESEIAQGLSFLKTIARSIKRNGRDGLWLGIIAKKILVAQGKLSDLPSASSLIHTWLEVRWCLLFLLYHVENIDQEDEPRLLLPDNFPVTGFLNELLTATIFDLLSLAENRLAAFPLTYKNFSGFTLFDCPCIEEAWLCVVAICKLKNYDPWQTILNICCPVDDAKSDKNICGVLMYKVKRRNNNLFMGIISSLTNLMKVSGADNENSFKDCTKTIRKFVRTIFVSLEAQPDEQALRLVLQFCLSIQSAMGPSLDLLDELWKYFSATPRLNSAYRLNKMTLDGTTSLPVSPSAWLTKLQTLASRSLNPKCAEPLTSFFSFMQLIVRALKQWEGDKNSDRLFMRLQRKLSSNRFVQLNEYGLYHLGSLLIALCQSGKTCSLSDLLQMLEINVNGSTSSFVTKVKCGFALCLLLVDKGESIIEVGEVVTKLVGSTVAEYVTDRNNIGKKQAMQDVVKAWRIGLEEVTDQSLGLTSGEGSLLQNWLSSYCQLTSDEETGSLCRTLGKLLARVRAEISTLDAITTEEKARIASLITTLWRLVYPELKTRIRHLTAPEEVAHLLADFVLLEAESINNRIGSVSRNPEKETIEEMIRATDRSACPRMSLKFLRRLTEHTVLCDYTKILAERLLCLTLNVGPDNTNYHELQEAWHNIEKRLLLERNTENETRDIAIIAIKQLVVRKEHHQLVRRFAIDTFAQFKREKVASERVYLVAGWLMRMATSIINQSNSSVFAGLLNIFIPRQALAHGWKLSVDAKTKSSIALALSDFLIGLANSKSFLDDKNMRQHFEHIIKLYFPFWDVNYLHPFTSLVCETELYSNHEQFLDVQLLILRTLFNLASSNASLRQRVLQFLQLCSATMSGDLSHIHILVVPLLLEFLMKDTGLLVKNLSCSLLKDIVKDIVKHGKQVKLMEPILTHVTKELAFNSERVFQSLMGIAVIDPTFAKLLIQPMQDQVRKIEIKRGNGQDKKLQDLLRKFEDSIYNQL